MADSSNAIKAGDLVSLKSGGPTMTVSSISDGMAFCEWFVSSERKTARIRVTSLDRINPDDLKGYA